MITIDRYGNYRSDDPDFIMWNECLLFNECVLLENNIELQELGMSNACAIWFDKAAKARSTGHHEIRVKAILNGTNKKLPLIITRSNATTIKGHTNKEIRKFSELKKFLLDNYDDIEDLWNERIKVEELFSRFRKKYAKSRKKNNQLSI